MASYPLFIGVQEEAFLCCHLRGPLAEFECGE